MIFRVQVPPDPTLAALTRWLQDQGYRTEPGQAYDLVARKGPLGLHIGLGPHRDGLACRLKAKSLLPGRAGPALRSTTAFLADRLGAPVDRTDQLEGSR